MPKKPTARRKGPVQPVVLITRALLRKWPLPDLDGHLGKEERGQVLVVGGSVQIPGAVLLAGIGALRAGAGTLQIATAARVAAPLAIAMPEARVFPLRHARDGELAENSCRVLHQQVMRSNALLIGPGMMQPRAAAQLLAHCLAGNTKATLVLDAAGIAALKPERRALSLLQGYSNGVIATPHAGEMAKLCDVERSAVLAAPLEFARSTAERFNIVVVLKGAETFIAAPDGRAFRNVAGNVGLGTSGSGDALSGIIAGLSARGADPVQAAVWGVHLHALAGDVLARKLGQLGFLAREVLTEIPGLLATLSR